MNQEQDQHLLELIVNSSAKQKGDFTGTAELVCDSIRQYSDASQVSVWLFRRDFSLQDQILPNYQQEVSYTYNNALIAKRSHHDWKIGTQELRAKLSFPDAYFKSLRKHRYVYTQDPSSYLDCDPFYDYLNQTKLNCVLDIAIRINGHIEGVLSIEHIHSIDFAQDELQLFIQCADQLALTLATRQAYDKNEQIHLLRNAIDQSQHVVMLVNLETQLVDYVNIAHQKMTGLKRETVINGHVSNLDIFRNNPEYLALAVERLKRAEVLSGNTKLNRIDGSEYYLHYHITPFTTEQGNQYALVSSYDNSSEYQYRAELEKLAWHCSLTGLNNRSYFKPLLDKTKSGYLVIVDIIGFKRFNDTHGHESGDALLIEFARRIKHFAKANKAINVSRIGSDEFALILPESGLLKQTEQLMQKLYQKLNQSVMVNREKIEAKAAIAVVDLKSLASGYAPLSCADIALQNAKKSVSTHLQFFNNDLLNTFESNAEVERDLRKAISGRQFELYYQPLKDLQQQDYIGAEALIRWNHPKKGVLYPGAFIEVAEQTGLINAMGEWVLETACKQLNIWQHNNLEISMHVNVAARQFFSGNLFEQVWTLLTRYRIKPQSLILEITETELMGDIRYATMLCQELADLGVGLAIDDFGTGYSSMKYLKQFPITKLKIDRSFIMDITSSHESREIVSAIIAMAKALRISLTAEGVETQEQERFLTDLCCHHAQGFLYSPALRVNEFSQFIANDKRLNS
ncbi:EAL domain-containing protein [Shewanella maritima]|uniref:bifunctional diguanylate cyclase/phosphodiesterase n=1 Tax=Shewanella maritima TaxID=2520507 RepID=UPI00373602CE